MDRDYKRAICDGKVLFSGKPMTRKAEVQHAAIIGITGTGNSVVRYALVGTALERGDRLIVTDHDGSAMSLFYKSGDIILNPHDVPNQFSPAKAGTQAGR